MSEKKTFQLLRQRCSNNIRFWVFHFTLRALFHILHNILERSGNWIQNGELDKKTNKIILFTINMCKMGDWRGGTKIVIIWMKVLSKTYKTGRETWIQTHGKHVTMLNIKLSKVIYFRQKLMMNILNLIYV